MRDLTELDEYRMRGPSVVEIFGTEGGSHGGAFVVASSVDGSPLRVIASNGDGWDHVSVSRRDRCPTWEEMERVKRLFFKPTETAMQFHVPVDRHINVHPYCLHLWRPHFSGVALPPSIMVG